MSDAPPPTCRDVHQVVELDAFRRQKVNDVTLLQLSDKTSMADLMPNSLKQTADLATPIFIALGDWSLQDEKFSSIYKGAFITPIIRDPCSVQSFSFVICWI